MRANACLETDRKIMDRKTRMGSMFLSSNFPVIRLGDAGTGRQDGIASRQLADAFGWLNFFGLADS